MGFENVGVARGDRINYNPIINDPYQGILGLKHPASP